MGKSKIEWTNNTLNCVTGCTRISAGCKNCYALAMTKRLSAIKKQTKYKNGEKVTCHPDQIEIPYKMRESTMYFVNSMSDTFHKKVPVEFCTELFNMMNNNRRHTFQLLTKRSGRLLELESEFFWSDNIWMGVTVENADYCYRIDNLRRTGAFIKFLSLEPLLGPLPDLNLSGIDWVIVGGESGRGSRPMKEKWVVDIKNQCIKQNVRFFFKQRGGREKKMGLPMLNGRTWSQMPKAKNRTPKLFA